MKPRVVIAGGSGFIGHALGAALRASYDVVVLSRSGRGGDGVRAAKWDGATLGDWRKEVDGAFAVINLSGESITLPWTDENKKRIVDSRVNSTAVLREAILASAEPPQVWINGSAVGFYGDTGETVADESSRAGTDFLSTTCLAWEGAVEPNPPQTRVVLLRTGFVLGKDGGAFPLLLKLTRAFIGGAVGSGQQWVPWVHVDDLVGLFVWALTAEVSGPVNGCAPQPVRNSELMGTLRKVVGRPWVPPAPAFALGLLSKFGGPEAAPALVSSRAVPAVALRAGFVFRFTYLATAMRSLV
ncbi:MAG: TIGR01777 family oxidoreductase [Fimbriimonas sp.]